MSSMPTAVLTRSPPDRLLALKGRLGFGRYPVHYTRIPKTNFCSEKAGRCVDEKRGNVGHHGSLRRLRRVLRWNSVDSRTTHANRRGPFSLMDAVDNMVLNQQSEEKVRWWVRDRHYTLLGSACPSTPWQRNLFYRPLARTIGELR